MEKEQKKEYVKPEMSVQLLNHKNNLLQDSCVGDGCVDVDFVK